MFLLLLFLESFILSRADAANSKNDFRNALQFINSVRGSSFLCENYGISLPELSLYTATPNKVVNCLMEEQYIAFWQELRQRSYSQDNKQLVELSMGTAVGLHEMTQKKAKAISKGTFETNLLKPLFYHNDMREAYLKCKLQNNENILDCVEDVVGRSRSYPVMWKEMTLSAVWMLKMALNIATGGSYALLDILDFLRSDDRAIACVRDWDRITTIPKILYLTFLIQARQLIAHLTENVEEAGAAAKLHMDLGLLINTEFPSKMIRVVKQEQAVYGALWLCEDQVKKRKHLIKQALLISVKQKDKKLGKVSTLFVYDGALYVSVPDYFIDNDPEEVRELFGKIMEEVWVGSLTLKANPMGYGG